MITQIILAVIAVVVPILWAWWMIKMNNFIKEQDVLIKDALLFTSVEMEQVSTEIMKLAQELGKDGELSPEDREKLVAKFKKSLNSSKVEFMEKFVPRLYARLIEIILSKK